MTLTRVADLSDADREALRVLSAAVYPPSDAEWSGAKLEWAAAEWCVRVYGDDGALLSYVGLSVRDAKCDGRPVRVGGIGGVKTHPTARRRGLAARGMTGAVEFFRDQGVGFALLVCGPHLLEYYGGLGWREFSGRLRHGTIDLLGPPW